ncbi:toxin [Longimycelium tulufanense]|uniref:Toxin n=1 Tax=Longimycelium tulufanense TaxID=907463 RepID=A0A8J3C8Z3_9PSEU|nr:DUF397 domain-containing protein [Longimycelium tulufanense]GGM36364.1 toxin [Longimycelium tulufanense]
MRQANSWCKSSYSSQTNCVEVACFRRSSKSSALSNCVEVAHTRTDWRKSSRSAAQSDCVEVALCSHLVLVRDSKNPDGPVLRFTPSAWTSFLRFASSNLPAKRAITSP